MNFVVSDLSDEALGGTLHYKLDVLYPLWLSVYYNEAYQRFIELQSITIEMIPHIKGLVLSRNMTTHLASTIDEQRELRQKFNVLLESQELKKYNLDKVADTLFYTCLHFLAVHWSNADYSIGSSGSESHEGYYPSTKKSSIENTKELSNLFLLFNKAKTKHCVTEVTISIGGIPIKISEPQLRTWIVESLEKGIAEGDFPLGALGEEMALLSMVLKKKTEPPIAGQTDILDDLSILTSIKEHKYLGQQNRIIKQYCLDVHKILSCLMGEDPEHFTNKQLRLYAYILKLFKIHDFIKRDKSKKLIANRLRSVITASS